MSRPCTLLLQLLTLGIGPSASSQSPASGAAVQARPSNGEVIERSTETPPDVRHRIERSLEVAGSNLRASRMKLGDRHADTLAHMSKYAAVLHATGKLTESAELSRETLEGNRATFGSTHPATLTATGNYAETLREQGRTEEAISVLGGALLAAKDMYGDDHPQTMLLAAIDAHARASRDGSLQPLREVVNHMGSTLDPAHPFLRKYPRVLHNYEAMVHQDEHGEAVLENFVVDITFSTVVTVLCFLVGGTVYSCWQRKEFRTYFNRHGEAFVHLLRERVGSASPEAPELAAAASARGDKTMRSTVSPGKSSISGHKAAGETSSSASGSSFREQASLRSQSLSTAAPIRRTFVDAWDRNDAHTAAFKDWWWYSGNSFASAHNITMGTLLAIQIHGMFTTCFGWIYVCCSFTTFGFGLGELTALAARWLGRIDPLDQRRRRVIVEVATECGLIVGGSVHRLCCDAPCS